MNKHRAFFNFFFFVYCCGVFLSTTGQNQPTPQEMMQLQAVYLGGSFMSYQMQGKLSWTALLAPAAGPGVLQAVK